MMKRNKQTKPRRKRKGRVLRLSIKAKGKTKNRINAQKGFFSLFFSRSSSPSSKPLSLSLSLFHDRYATNPREIEKDTASFVGDARRLDR